jgi:fermentation-respiration switch protein FrsA (DUF1100 family)
LPEKVEEKCLSQLGELISASADELFQAEFLEQVEQSAWEESSLGVMLEEEDLSGTSVDIPLLIVHGTEDELLPLELTEALAKKLSNAGTPVEFLAVEGGDHLFLPWTAREEVWEFLDG